MASLPPRATSGLASDVNGGGFASHAKIRGRTIVKPILKKLNSHSNSDRGSFDLDPVWDDQPSPLSFPPAEYDTVYSDTTPALTPGAYDLSTPASASNDTFRPRDVSFSTSASSEYPTWRSKNKYSHVRSTSGTSHTSSIATNISGRNGGTFVHPFQQTPRTATPPLSYANSIASLDISAPATREYAATITEQDDAVSPTSSTTHVPLRTASLSKSATFSMPPPPYTQNMRYRGPSLDETHSRTYSEGTQTPRMIPTSRSHSASTALYVPETATSEALLASTAPYIAPITTSASSSATPNSPSPLSPLRNSLDISGFRLRSRSEVDTRSHQEQVRDARRKYQEKEKAKDEKYARQQLRRRERHDPNRERAKIRKPTTSSTSTAKSSAASSRYAGSHTEGSREKLDFTSSAYDHAPTGQTPARADEVQFQRPKRRKSAKHKTNGVFTAFMLWFRTRLLRLGK